MDVTARDLRDLELSDSFRGYNKDEVNDLLNRAASTIEALETRVRQLGASGPAPAAAPAAAGSAADESVNAQAAARTLALAQRVADETVAEAETQALDIVAKAQTQCEQLVAEAEREVRRIHEVERAQAESEIVELNGRRASLHAALDELASFERDYRERLLGSIEADLERARSISSVIDTPRPVIADATELLEVVDRDRGDLLVAADDERSEGVDDANAVSNTTNGSEAIAPPLVGSAKDPADDLADESGADPVATIDLAEEQAAERAAIVQANIDQGAPDDSDDFFASLREATSDTTSLSASEERLFDTDDDRDSTFRDVFRRRR
jgi:DivIVA domain-containing protein